MRDADKDSFGGPSPPVLSEQQPCSVVAKPRKARKAQGDGTGRSNRRGKLNKLPNMPLDVLFEIFSHLEPVDLLHLARTSKSFRALLMSRHNATLWRAARHNIPGLPDCPDDMSEPALANLLFQSHCHGCGKPNTQRIFWDCGLRYCKKCEEPIKRESRWWSGGMADYALDPLELTKETVHTQLYQLFKVFTDDADELFSHRPLVLILQRDVEAVRAVLAVMTVEERGQFLQKRKAQRRQWIDQIAQIWRWHVARSTSRKNELGHIREARYASILEKLEELGWGDEVRGMDARQTGQFKKLCHARTSKPMTDRAWAATLPSILAFLEMTKEARLELEKPAKYRERILLFRSALAKIHNYRPGEPSELDIALGLPRVRELVESPLAATLDASSFAFLRDALPPFAAQWKQDARDALRRLVRRSTPPPPADGVDPLALAVGQRFRCRVCAAEADARDIVSHACRRAAPDGEAADAFRAAALRALEPVLWAPRDIEPCRGVAWIVPRCGLDARTATPVDLDGCAVRFECVPCNPREGVKALAWRSALDHLDDDDEMPHELRVLPEDVACAARRMQRALPPENRKAIEVDDSDGNGRVLVTWKCLVCPQSTHSWRHGVVYKGQGAVLLHLKEEHGIDAPVEFTDYHRAHPKPFEPTVPDVYLISDVYSEPRLSRKLEWSIQQALVEGKAEYFALLGDDGKPWSRVPRFPGGRQATVV